MARKKSKINTAERDALRKLRGENLRKVLSSHGMSQLTLADKIGYTPEHVSYIVNGTRNLTLEAAEKVVSLFPDVRLDWLMGLNDYPSQKEEMIAKVKKSRSNTKIRYEFMQYLFESCGYCFKYLSKNKEIPGVELEEDFYGAIEGELVTSCITIGEFRNLVCEMENYASYLVKKTVEQGKSRVAQPFHLPKDVEGEKNG